MFYTDININYNNIIRLFTCRDQEQSEFYFEISKTNVYRK